MIKLTNNKKKVKTNGLLNKSIGYNCTEQSVEFYTSEETAT